MAKQLLLLRIEHLNDEIRQFTSGMRSMGEVRYDSPEVKADNDMLRYYHGKKESLLKDLAEIDALIEAKRLASLPPTFATVDDEVSYYMDLSEIPEKYRDDARRCVENMSRFDMTWEETSSHLRERVIEEEDEENL